MKKLEFDLESYKNNTYGSHNYHAYPAKFVPQIPNELMTRYSSPGNTVLDPFCGSGTTLVEARQLGRHSIGTDVNPLACLISRVKVTYITPEEVSEIKELASEIEAGAGAGAGMNMEMTASPPIITNIDKWFAPHIQHELCWIRDNILRAEQGKVRDFMFVAFSSIIIKVSFQESDTRYRAVPKDLPPGICVSLFSTKIAAMLKRQSELNETDREIFSEVINVDSTDLTNLPRRVDLVVTSPPYLNSYDYYLYHKHRLSWLGFDHYIVQSKEFGSRNKHNDKGLGADAYEQSISSHVESLRQFLNPGAKYACVVGDGVLRGTLHKADKMFDQIFNSAGFTKIDQFSFDQRKYTRAFTPNLRTQAKETHVLIYQFS